MVNMKIDRKILEEINRYKSINNYIMEQDAPVEPDPADAPLPAPDAGLPPAPEAETPQPIDVAQDPDVEEVGKDEEDKEELEITDLVNSQKNIETKQDEYFDNLFKQLENLENRLGEMDNLMAAVNSLEQKIEKYRPKTPEEKLELRSLDSGPFNQKLSDYFEDKEDQFEKQGREEYILTTDEAEDFSPKQIKDTFDTYDDDDMMP